MNYTYSLKSNKEFISTTTYRYEELIHLTTLQLREICSKEKIVIGSAYKLDREHIINTILKYRGENLYTFIDTYLSDRFEPTIEKFKDSLNFYNSTEIHLPTKITLYKNVDITQSDNYIVRGEGIYTGNVLLLDENNKIVGILNIKSLNGHLYIFSNHNLICTTIGESLYKNYSLGFLDKRGSKHLYNHYYEIGKIPLTKLNCQIVPISELLITTIEESIMPLIIDFGTSNSSAGAYIDEHFIKSHVKTELVKSGVKINNINKIKFTNTLKHQPEISEIVPTVISIKDCSDPSNVKYRYGYNALGHAKRNSYNNPASVFYGIKKWINNYESVI